MFLDKQGTFAQNVSFSRFLEEEEKINKSSQEDVFLDRKNMQKKFFHGFPETKHKKIAIHRKRVYAKRALRKVF